MTEILYTGLHHATLVLLEENLQRQSITLAEITEQEIKDATSKLQKSGTLLIGEEVGNPIRVAQEAYAADKQLSVLIINDEHNFLRVKQSLQFSPFIGHTVQCVSNQVKERLVDILQDALQRTEQRRSFRHFSQSFVTQVDVSKASLDKVRGEFTAKVLEEAPIGAILVSEHGHVLTINTYAAHLFKKTEREILGRSLAVLFPEEMQKDVDVFLQQEPIAIPKKVFNLKLQKEQKFLELSLARVQEQASNRFRILIINDITAATLAQRSTQVHLEELEEMNANLKRLNNDLDTFVYTASHDLKSPILNIEGLVTLLEYGLGDDKQQVEAELEHIKISIQRFKNTVEDLTEVARIQKNFEQEAVLLRIDDVVEQVKESVSFEIRAAEAVIEVDSTAAPQLHFAKHNLKSIIYNLISNGIKYRSPDKTPVINIRTWQQENDFYLEVKDNGVGIPENSKEKVFELFKRVHEHVKGTGIGLYIVKRIVQNNGGAILLESTEGKGSTFIIKLKV
ncbi:sensor histidine kinase [Pontibacter rugosus]|uniref:histidine kinase n=1 Tax=Pontibacter rugosus TaxID=1745966 RepID=A0ABW3SJN3_9BACT